MILIFGTDLVIKMTHCIGVFLSQTRVTKYKRENIGI